MTAQDTWPSWIFFSGAARWATGRRGCRGRRNREPCQKVVVLTNYATPEVRRRAAELGAGALWAYCIEQTAKLLTEDVQEAQRKAVAQHNQAMPT